MADIGTDIDFLFIAECFIWPVSYTHLDVYKRQVWSIAATSGAGEGGLL